MKELNKLKKVWKQQEEHLSKAPGKSQLQKAMQYGTNKHIRKFKQNVFIELAFGVLVFIGISILMIIFPYSDFGVYMTLPMIIFCASMVYYFIKLLEIKKTTNYQVSIKCTLIDNLIKMKTLARTYVVLNLLLMLIMFPLVVFFVINYYIDPDQLQLFFNREIKMADKLIFSALYSIVLVVVVYPLIKAYSNMMFGRYIKQLENSINEINEE